MPSLAAIDAIAPFAAIFAAIAATYAVAFARRNPDARAVRLREYRKRECLRAKYATKHLRKRLR